MSLPNYLLVSLCLRKYLKVPRKYLKKSTVYPMVFLPDSSTIFSLVSRALSSLSLAWLCICKSCMGLSPLIHRGLCDWSGFQSPWLHWYSQAFQNRPTMYYVSPEPICALLLWKTSFDQMTLYGPDLPCVLTGISPSRYLRLTESTVKTWVAQQRQI